MNGDINLSGYQILLAEDEYFIATNTACELQGAGAQVIGPCANEEAAQIALAGSNPDAAVVDINLGHGPSFKLAEALQNRSIPFLFLTGYDRDDIPQEFIDIRRIEKPFHSRQIISAVSLLLNVPEQEQNSVGGRS